MSQILPQQRLLLELIIMSGDVAVPSVDNGTVFFRTLKECEGFGWIQIATSSSGIGSAMVTNSGRKIV